jgi:diguanylate cyclase (GGDEF)-like protein
LKCWVFLGFLLFSSFAFARVPADLASLRSQAVNDPPSAIAEGRKLLDSHKLAGRNDDEREVLYWLGNAALRETDDAALAEMALRLEDLGSERKDELALAYAGLLRAERLYQQGDLEKGWGETMRAASRIQDSPDPQIRAIAATELCDDFYMVGNARAGLPYCERSTSAWRTFGDKFELGRALNLEGRARKAAGDFEHAAERFKESRELFLANGDRNFASTVGANLARCYVETGRAEEALQLLQEGWEAETRSGRLFSAFLSKADMVDALIKLGRLADAQKEVTLTIADARAHGWTVKLPELLTSQAQIARGLGDTQLALAAQDQLIELQSHARDQAHLSAMAELEARYAARERELRIGELEQENRRRELELQTQRASAAEDQASLERQRARLAFAALIIVVLGVILALLCRMWYAQRRKADALHVETLHDPLTGVENRRSFLRRVEAALADPGKAPLLDVLMIIDLDHFKQVNDRGGHLFGDEVLIAVVKCIERHIGGRAHLARLGGEEFGVLARGMGAAEGLRLAEQLRTAVSLMPVRHDSEHVRVTISVGFAVHDCDVRRHTQSTWLAAADQALYSAKAHGRNRVVSAAVA